jgi:hypothetical protein
MGQFPRMRGFLDNRSALGRRGGAAAFVRARVDARGLRGRGVVVQTAIAVAIGDPRRTVGWLNRT